MTPPRTNRPPLDPGRAERVLDVAEQHFGRHGFRRTSISDIAREAGCAKGSVYLDFDSKEALLDAVIARTLARVGEEWERELGTSPTVLEHLEKMLRLTFRKLGENPLFERLVQEDPELSAISRIAQQAASRERAAASLQGLRELLRQGIASGELRPDLDVERVPFVLASLKFLHFHAGMVSMGLLTREQLLDAVVDVFIAGVAARPGGSP